MSRRVTYYNSSYASFQYDVDALEFITNWELSTSAIMPLTQRLAVNDLYRGLKGEGTPTGTDFWTPLVSRGAVLFPLIPLDNSTANADAYKLDAISKGVHQGDYVNFASGDFTPEGVIGGSAKYFNINIPTNTYGTNNNSFGVYSRTDINASLIDLGESLNTINIRVGERFRFRINNSTEVLANNTNSQGLAFVGHIGGRKRAFRNTTILTGVNSQANSGQSEFSKYAHARNIDGTADVFSTRQLCCYFDGVIGMTDLTPNELTDFYTIIQRLQSNVIAGGRQIGTPIAPI
jgi:hypothetical protein